MILYILKGILFSSFLGWQCPETLQALTMSDQSQDIGHLFHGIGNMTLQESSGDTSSVVACEQISQVKSTQLMSNMKDSTTSQK